MGGESGATFPSQQSEQMPGAAVRAVVSISHTREKHRSIETVGPLVEDAIGRIGGMGRFVRPGHTVLVKLNVTVLHRAEEGCTTDPLMMRALVRSATRQPREECGWPRSATCALWASRRPRSGKEWN